MSTPAPDLQATMARVVRADIQGLHAYAVQPSAGMVKVDTMENPHPLPPALQQALGERLGRVAIHRYPAQCAADVVARLSAFVGLPPGCKLILGNGSDELIDILSVACNRPGATVLAPLPGFVMYEMSAKLQGLGFVGVPLVAVIAPVAVRLVVVPLTSPASSRSPAAARLVEIPPLTGPVTLSVCALLSAKPLAVNWLIGSAGASALRC